MYASPVTSTTSQLSQPSSSISARDVGKNGAMPKRSAQYGRCENSARGDVVTAPRCLARYCPPSQGSLDRDLVGARLVAAGGGGGAGGGGAIAGCGLASSTGGGAPPPGGLPSTSSEIAVSCACVSIGSQVSAVCLVASARHVRASADHASLVQCL